MYFKVLTSCHLVCRLKSQGGSGVRECYKWNLALMAKYAWNVAQKRVFLCIKWVNHIYLKGANWWDYEPPKSASWSWKEVQS